ncbi:MAG: EamA family transporter [Ignavibacteria bacterium]|jgi:drug/metabolite transporter (DMT)-like permease
MIYLLIVSLIWAFSFGLIKDNLTGLDSNFVAFARLFLSLIVFMPFLRLKNITAKLRVKLILTGAVQYGIMYLTYIYSYQFLKAYEVAIFVIFMPLYVTLINDILERRFSRLFLITSILSIAGAAVIVYKEFQRTDFIIGLLLMQVSNLCFAFGQVYYKKIFSNEKHVNDSQMFALLYLGAVLITGVFASFSISFSELAITSTQLYSLIYLGAISSGLCFFLWNLGARKTDAGTLAVMNNFKVPLAVAASVFIFGEEGDLIRMSIGLVIILTALFFNGPLMKRLLPQFIKQ